MTESLLIVLIVAIIFIFVYLSNKIRSLEKEVSKLNNKINTLSQQSTVIKEQPLSNEIPVFHKPALASETDREKQKTSLAEQLPIPSKSDWTEPIFDFLKQNILTVIGIFTLVLGIGYFVKYAIDKNWIGEGARAGIGLGTGAVILLIGYFLRKNYSIFSSIITGGGIAVLYFTTTITFREYHLFTQNTAFVITTLITIISIILSYHYKSEILIIFSLLGGFLAPLMISTGQSNYPFLFIYLTLLNIGMLAVVFLKHWKSIGWVAFTFTAIYLFYWTSTKCELLSILFYIISYVIFYVFALQNYIRKNILPGSDIMMLVLINFSSVIGLVYIFKNLEYEPSIIFPLVFALINGLLLFREYGKKNFGISYSVFAGLTISLVTLAFAIQFNTNLITIVWAVEATLLLFIWKKTNLSIFKNFFYILFPLVIIAQLITWSKYADAEELAIVFNRIFLTSLVTVVSSVINLFLLKKTNEEQKTVPFFETLFSLINYTIIYIALLLEIVYHISSLPGSFITSISLLFSIYYIFVLLLFRNKLSLSTDIQNGFIYLFFVLTAVHASISATALVTSILLQKIRLSYYFIHLLYWIPFIYMYVKIVNFSNFYGIKISYWIISFVFVLAVSYGFYNLYVIYNTVDLSSSYKIKQHFTILYLPIIWTLLASTFIYMGLKKNIQDYNKIGFTLIGIMVLKLYAYDIWQMDNISRITAFIILGIILLLSSFMFQRFKNIIKNMVDKKEKNNENTDL